MRTIIMLTACLLTTLPSAWATDSELKPSEVFAADAPSIVLIKSYDDYGKPIALGSGVVIAKNTVVSNCHVIEKATSASVFYQHKQLATKLLYADVEHDLCSFTVKDLTATPVQMGSISQVKVGDTAYAIGAPEGLELTLSGGLISSIRKVPGGVVLQMTTPISHGSSGGGLFDSQARLIGITAYAIVEGEQLNFAISVEWVKELPQRGKLTKTNKIQFGHTVNTNRDTGSQQSQPQLDNDSMLLKAIDAFQAGAYKAAFKIFEIYAKKGNVIAQYDVGTMYYQGYGVPQNNTQAFIWLSKAAEHGSAGAQGILGTMYLEGDGVPQSYIQAVVWYRKAVIQGDVYGQYCLGRMYELGNGVPQDYAQAVVWYHKAAMQKFSPGQFALGLMYELGKGVPQDYGQAVEWYRKAAELGDSEAQAKLGYIYSQGKEVPQDFTQAVEWNRKAIAQENAIALSNFGVMYGLGQGVPQNFVVAYALFNFSATLNATNDNKAVAGRSLTMNSMTPAQIEAGQALTREMQRVGVLKALDAFMSNSTQ